MDSVPAAGPTPLKLQARAGADATLHVDIPVELAGVDYNLVIVVQRADQGPMQSPPLTIVLSAEVERDEDARWFAEIPQVPSAFAQGQTRDEAIQRATALALRVLADRLEGVEGVGLDEADTPDGAG
jgi:predicted RNase H-like HicB family nuclease